MKRGRPKGSSYHGKYNKVHPKWTTIHHCEVCGKEMIANGINWHNDKCAWKGIDMDKVYDALKNHWSVKKIMETYGTTMYTTNMMKKGFYPNYPAIHSDGRKTAVHPKRSYGGHDFTKTKGTDLPSELLWEYIDMGWDIDKLYKDIENKKKKYKRHHKSL